MKLAAALQIAIKNSIDLGIPTGVTKSNTEDGHHVVTTKQCVDFQDKSNNLVYVIDCIGNKKAVVEIV